MTKIASICSRKISNRFFLTRGRGRTVSLWGMCQLLCDWSNKPVVTDQLVISIEQQLTRPLAVGTAQQFPLTNVSKFTWVYTLIYVVWPQIRHG